MIHYRLLRDNKETGPYSEEEMIAKGFKPYDLLWAEGKSAGWQYPSEIVAFKKYAPVVEEQPYDRFYKKPVPQLLPFEEKKPSLSYTPIGNNSKDSNRVVQQPPVARPSYQYNVQDLPARHIHVTLPSGNTVNLTTLAAKKEQVSPIVVEAPSVSSTVAEKTVVEKKPSSFSDVIAAAQQPAATKEINTTETASNNYINHQPAYAPSGTNFSWTLVAGAVIGIATLVGLGIMIGLSINSTRNETAFNAALQHAAAKQVIVAQAVKSATASASLPAAIVPEELPQHRTPVKSKEAKQTLVQNAVVKTVVVPVIGTKDEKKIPADNATDKNKLQLQESAVHVKAITPVTSTAAIERSLQITPNKFKTGAFGGISGLKCTLVNGSKTSLESVEVEVDYIQANNKLYKTERLLFKDITAGGEATIEAPASSRGIKVVSRVVKINAKEALTNTTVKS